MYHVILDTWFLTKIQYIKYIHCLNLFRPLKIVQKRPWKSKYLKKDVSDFPLWKRTVVLYSILMQNFVFIISAHFSSARNRAYEVPFQRGIQTRAQMPREFQNSCSLKTKMRFDLIWNFFLASLLSYFHVHQRLISDSQSIHWYLRPSKHPAKLTNQQELPKFSKLS